jgi:hypothetical protein
MSAPSRGRAVIKFLFWTIAAAGVVVVVIHTFRSGQMSAWFYHRAASDGYAVNADAFKTATPQSPAVLEVGTFATLDGLQAVQVKKGDRLPARANGVISLKVLKEGKRAVVDQGRVVVKVPWEIQTAKGFKFKDTFKHKGIRTWPWGAVFNVGIIFALGICLGYMAEGFTDVLGIRIAKIRHFEGH